jgi:DNA-3-methyladenine glycosylase
MDAPDEDTLFDLGVTVPLPVEFFARAADMVARELLGCVVVSRAGGALTAGRIVETEAYLGAEDPGSHAATRGVTPRNLVMFGAPGVAYVYFTYGNHHMLNAVCEPDGVAGAVLVRALEPVAGADIMTRRRHGRAFRELCSGPGRLTQALAIDLDDNGTRFGEGRIALLPGERIDEPEVGVSGRVGLSNGYDLPLRFFVSNSEYVSKGRTGPPRHRAARG